MGLREARKEQTVRELERLLNELDAWKKRRIAADTTPKGKDRGRHDSQLTAIVREVRAAAVAVREALGGDLAASSLGEVCKAFNLHDQRIIWIRYVWDYFREKLDQRDDATLRPALEAADEVLWSCYRAYFAGRNDESPPPPIATLAFDYSSLRASAGHVLDRRVDVLSGPLKEYFLSLPVGVLRLPPTIVTAPWTLAIIGHEVGHFLQDPVEAGAAKGEGFADRIEAAVRSVKSSESDVKYWRACASEIFADWIAILTIGPWAIWALAPLVLTDDSAMLTRQRPYPSAAVRLYLLGEMSRGLSGVERQLAALGVSESIAVTAESQTDMKIARAVAETLKQPLGDASEPLATLFDFRKTDYDPQGDVDEWSSSLLDFQGKSTINELRAARTVASGAAKAHFDLVNAPDPEARLTDRLSALAARTTRTISESFDKAKRDAPTTRAVDSGRLARLLLQLGEEALQA